MSKKELVKKVRAVGVPQMVFADGASLMGRTEAGFTFAKQAGTFSSTMRFKVGNAVYAVKHFKFYDENGVVIETPSGYFERATYNLSQPDALILPQVDKIKRKDKPEFDGTVFFISVGKDRFGLEKNTLAEVYIPMSFLDTIGYEVYEEKWVDTIRPWETTIKRSLKTDRIEMIISYETKKDLEHAKKSLIAEIEAAPDTETIRKIFERYKYI